MLEDSSVAARKKDTKTNAVLDCKTVRIFVYSSTREQSNKRSGTRLKTESETGERRFSPSRLTRPTISLLILRKKTDCFAVECCLIQGSRAESNVYNTKLTEIY